MKTFTRLLLLLSLCGGSLFAQDTYYWSGETQVPLVENRSSLMVEFYQPVNQAELPTAHPQFGAFRDDRPGPRKRVVYDFIKPQTAHPEEIAAQLGLSPQAVRSAAWGFNFSNGGSIWLSHQVAYEPGPNFDAAAFEAFLAGYGTVEQKQTPTGIHYLELPELEAVLPLANALHTSGLVAWAHPDYVGKVELHNSPCPPSDPYYVHQYYLDNRTGVGGGVNGDQITDINAPEAWCITTGDPSLVVAVIDEGCEAHEDLEDGSGSRVMTGYAAPGLGTTSSAPLVPGNAHGVAVSGIIAASHNNIGIAGVAPQVMVLPVLIDKGATQPLTHYADAINWAWQNEADVLNNSWGFDFPSPISATDIADAPVLEMAIQNARTQGRNNLGCPVLFSAGEGANGANGNPWVSYPSNTPGVITLGGIDLVGNIPFYTNRSTDIDVVTPTSRGGQNNDIRTLDRMGNLGYNPNATGGPANGDLAINYTKFFGGTSVSCAQGSGVAALLLSYNPGLTEAQVSNLIISTADATFPTYDPNLFGQGRVDAAAALGAAPPPGSPTPVEWLVSSGRVVGQQIRLDWATATELNNDYFAVEKLIEGRYQAIAEVDGAGTTEVEQRYQFVDQTPAPGRNTYRLRQVDFDGQFDFSPTIEVSFSPQVGLQLGQVYPQPAGEQVHFQLFADQPQQASYRVLDLQGRVLAQDHLDLQGATTLDLPVQNWASGLYLLQLSSQRGNTLTKKFVIQ